MPLPFDPPRKHRQVPYPSSLIVHALLSAKKKILLRLLVDTGATYTMIPMKAAIVIGCDPVSSTRRVPVVTVSAIEYPPLVTIPSLQCLGHHFQNIDIVCHDLPPQSAVDGLLGLNVLMQIAPFANFIESIQSYLI